MFCPVCKAEYRLGFTRCSTCDVDLVEKLEDSQASSDAAGKAGGGCELLWSGNSPQLFDELRDALQAAGIPFRDRLPEDTYLYSSLRPPLEVWTHSRDHDAVEKVRREILGQDEAEISSVDSEVESDTAIGDDEDEDATDSESAVPDDIPAETDPGAMTAEVWSGDDGAMADTVRLCLRENGIGCLVDSARATIRIRVAPGAEARSREIIREVVEATPPQ